MDASLTAALGVGFLLGLRHATDADHVAAISTLVTQQPSVTRSCLLGAFWGAGHTVALLVAGTATLAVGLTIAPHVERGLELRACSSCSEAARSGGMLPLTTLIALPLSCTGMRWSAAGRAFEAAAGLGSLGLGLGLAWQLASSLSG
jgi:high-affinity nickel permease